MKFTNYHNLMRAATGLVQSGWTLIRTEIDDKQVTTISLYHDVLELSYILEHHVDKDTFEASQLKPFVRNRRVAPHIRYERENPFADILPVSSLE